jgi:hypothetical protein
LKGFEFIKAIHLDPEPFDMERDLITPTYKKKRPQLLKYYQVSLFYILGESIRPVCIPSNMDFLHFSLSTEIWTGNVINHHVFALLVQ